MLYRYPPIRTQSTCIPEKHLPLVLCIHGFFGSYREFEPLVSVLQGEGYLVYGLALPAHHQPETSTCQPPDITALSWDVLSQTVLDDVSQLLQENSYRELIVVGHSLGATLAWLVASQFTHHCVGLATLSTPFNEAYSLNAPFGYLFNAHKTISQRCQYALNAWTLPHHQTPFPKPSLSLKRYWYYRDWFQSQTQTILDKTAAIVPTVTVQNRLIVHGQYDLIVPIETVGKLSQSAGLTSDELVILNRCGHQIYPRTPETARMNRVMMDWLNHVIKKDG